MVNDTLDRTRRRRQEQEEALLRAYMASSSEMGKSPWDNARREVDAMTSPRMIARAVKESVTDPVGSVKETAGFYKDLVQHPRRTFDQGPISTLAAATPVVGPVVGKLLTNQLAAMPAPKPKPRPYTPKPHPHSASSSRVNVVRGPRRVHEPPRAGSGYHGKTAVVLDLAGSTNYGERLGDQATFALQKHVQDLARPVFEKYGASRHQHIGDGYAGVVPKDPRKALQLARELRDTIGTSPHQIPIPYRISVRSDTSPGRARAGGEIGDRSLWRSADEQGKLGSNFEIFVDQATLDGLEQWNRRTRSRIFGRGPELSSRQVAPGVHELRNPPPKPKIKRRRPF